MYVKTVSFRWTRRAVGVNSVCISCRRCSQTCLVLSKRQPWKYWTVVTVCFQECPCLESSYSFIINSEDVCSSVLDTRNYLIFCLMKWYISGGSDATVFEESGLNTDFNWIENSTPLKGAWKRNDKYWPWKALGMSLMVCNTKCLSGHKFLIYRNFF